MKTKQQKTAQLLELNRKIRNARAVLRRLEKKIAAAENVLCPKVERDTETLDWVEFNNFG